MLRLLGGATTWCISIQRGLDAERRFPRADWIVYSIMRPKMQARLRDMKVTRRVAHSEPRQSWSGPAPVDNDPRRKDRSITVAAQNPSVADTSRGCCRSRRLLYRTR